MGYQLCLLPTGPLYFTTENKRRRSLDVASIFGHEVIMIREKKLVNLFAVKSGMQRFNFLLDCCQPGSVPDAHLIAALLDLVSIQVDLRSNQVTVTYLFTHYCQDLNWILLAVRAL